MKSHNVRFWEIRPRKTAKGDSWTVRWTVAGREKSATLARKAQAERHRSRLMQAADRGEAFDTDTGLPDSMAHEASSVTWYEHACAFADARWPKSAAKGRISLVEGLMAVTPVLVTSNRGAPDPGVLRQAMRRWAYAIRRVPIPPVLVGMLREHIDTYGTAPDGRLFRTYRGGVYLPSTLWTVQQRARHHAFTPTQVASPLARRPYDFRHAGISWRLNAGTPAPLVAEWAGHTVEVLLRIYAHCLDGDDERWFGRMEDGLS